MVHLRRILAPLTAIWLFCQVGTAALVPVTLWNNVADPHAADCTCAHGGGAMWCPMHHKTASGPTECAMKAANGADSAVLTALAGFVGMLPESTALFAPAVPSLNPRPADAFALGDRPVPPDPPPPRA